MSKVKVTIKSHRSYDTSNEGILLGRYSYYQAAPATRLFIDYIQRAANKLNEAGIKNRITECFIAKTEHDTAEIIIKGKRADILKLVNSFISQSEITQRFNLEVK